MAGSMGQGMQQATQHQFGNPMWAAMMDPGGMHYAAPSMMTSAQTGAFRNDAVGDRRTTAPYSVTGQAPPPPMFPIPLSFGATSPLGVDTLTRTRPELMFSRGFDGQIDRGSEHARLLQGGFEDYAQGAGRTIAGMHGAAVGAGVGAGVGAFVGGPKGAVTGMEVGSLVGAFAGYIPGVDRATARMFRPAIERRADAIQTQFGTRQFLTGGQDLDITGSGLSTNAAQGLMEDFDEIASQQGLTRADVTQLMQLSGEQGLLDMASNADEIAETMKNMTSLLGTMAEITGDPDFMNNIRKIARLRRLGFDPQNVGQALRNMDSYARMAGMDIDQVMENQGMQGSATFNAAGLLASQGMQAGFMGTGQAHLMAQAGVFNERELALYGGQSGVGQHLMEANAAFMAGPMSESLMPFFLQRGEGGLEVDRSAMGRIISGEVGAHEMMSEAASRFHNDLDSVVEMQTNSRRLMMEIAEETGQEGMQAIMLMTAKDLADNTPGMDLRGALQTMGLDEAQSSVLHEMAHDSNYWTNLQQQQQHELRRLQFDERQRFENADTIGTSNLGRGWRGVKGVVSNAAGLWGLQEGVSNQLARHEEEQRRAASGLFYADGNFGGMDSESIERWASRREYMDEAVGGRGGHSAGAFERFGNRMTHGVSGGAEQQLIRTVHGETGGFGWHRTLGSRYNRLLGGIAATGHEDIRELELQREMDRIVNTNETVSAYHQFRRMSHEEQVGAMAGFSERVGDRDAAITGVGAVRSAMLDTMGRTSFDTQNFSVADMREALISSGMSAEQASSVLADGGDAQLIASVQRGMNPRQAKQVEQWGIEVEEAALGSIMDRTERGFRNTEADVVAVLNEGGHTRSRGRDIRRLDHVTDESWELIDALGGVIGDAMNPDEVDEDRVKAFIAQMEVMDEGISDERRAELNEIIDAYAVKDAEGAEDIRRRVHRMSQDAIDEFSRQVMEVDPTTGEVTRHSRISQMFGGIDGLDMDAVFQQGALVDFGKERDVMHAAIGALAAEDLDFEGVENIEELARRIGDARGDDLKRLEELGLYDAARGFSKEGGDVTFMEALQGLDGVGGEGLVRGVHMSSDEISAQEQRLGVTAAMKEAFADTWSHTEENTRKTAEGVERLIDIEMSQLSRRQRRLLEEED